MTAPPLSPLAPFPGYYNLAGSLAEDRFFFANEALVHSNMVFLDYTPLRWLRDLTAGVAGDRTYNNNLHNFTGPVIMFAAGDGFGPAMQDTAQLMTSATITLNVNEQLGHVDYPFALNHRQIFERPILNWLKTVNFQ